MTQANMIERAITLSKIDEYSKLAATFIYLTLTDVERFTLGIVKQRGTMGTLKKDADVSNYTPYKTLTGMNLIEQDPFSPTIRFRLTKMGIAVLEAKRINIKAHKDWFVNSNHERE